MMTDTGRTLKAVSLQFRNLSSAALRSNGDDARVNIRRLLTFVDTTPVLKAEVERAPALQLPLAEIWQQTTQVRDRLAFPDDPLEELGLLHALLTELSRNTGEEFWQRCYGYAGKHGLQDCVTEVLSDTVGRYSAHLRQVLELALLNSSDPAYESRRVEVHVSGGTNQVNVAQDRGRISAEQIADGSTSEIVESAKVLFNEAAELFLRTRDGEVAQVQAIATAVIHAMQQPKTAKFTLQAAKAHLETLAAATTIVSAVAPHASHLAALLGKFIGP